MLKLSLLFPDAPPHRYRVARQGASVRTLRRWVEDAHENGLGSNPIRAAEMALALISGLTKHDRRTRGHSERVRVYTDVLSEQMGLSDDDRDRLRWGALLHDIGKLEVPAPLLNKPGKPSPREWELLRAHPARGAHLTAPLLEWLGEWAAVISQHHERWDGDGYPLQLSGRDISRGARIVAVADAYETMTSARSYRRAVNHVAARQELGRCAGTQFDPAVVRAFLTIPLTRLLRVAGPVAWLIQLPLVRQLQPVASQLGPHLAANGASMVSAAAIGAAAVAVVPTMPGPTPPVASAARSFADFPSASSATDAASGPVAPGATGSAAAQDDGRATPAVAGSEPSGDGVALTAAPVRGQAAQTPSDPAAAGAPSTSSPSTPGGASQDAPAPRATSPSATPSAPATAAPTQPTTAPTRPAASPTSPATSPGTSTPSSPLQSVTEAAGTVIEPVTGTVTRVTAPVVETVATVTEPLAPVITPVVEAVTTVLAPATSTEAPVLAPVTTVLAPVVAPVLGTVTSTLGPLIRSAPSPAPTQTPPQAPTAPATDPVSSLLGPLFGRP